MTTVWNNIFNIAGTIEIFAGDYIVWVMAIDRTNFSFLIILYFGIAINSLLDLVYNNIPLTMSLTIPRSMLIGWGKCSHSGASATRSRPSAVATINKLRVVSVRVLLRLAVGNQ